MNPNIPLSELIRKEFYLKCSTAFGKAIQDSPALIKTDVLSKLKYFDSMYNVTRTPEDEE
jgi:hypothetical protein